MSLEALFMLHIAKERGGSIMEFYRRQPWQAALDGAMLILSAVICLNWRDMALFHFYVVATMILLGASGLSAGLRTTVIRTAAVAAFAVVHAVGHKGWGLQALSEALLLTVAGWTAAMFAAYRRWSRRDE